MESYPLSVVQWAQQQLSQFGRIGATRLVNVPALAAPVAIGAPASLAQAPLLTWRDPGTVIAMYGQELRGTPAAFATTGAMLQFMGDDNFITNGSAPDFASFLALFGPNVNWFPMIRRVKRGDNWTITYRNRDTGAVANPDMTFAFLADADIGRTAREMEQAKRNGG